MSKWLDLVKASDQFPHQLGLDLAQLVGCQRKMNNPLFIYSTKDSTLIKMSVSELVWLQIHCQMMISSG